jgi:hypothetical protein
MRFAALVAGVCLGLAWPGQSRAESPLEHLLASVRLAGGGPYLYHVRATLSDIEDGKLQQRVLELEGPRRFLQHCEGLACYGLFTDGQRSFETDSNGTAVPSGAPPAPFDTSLQAVLLEEFADPGFRAQGGSVAPLAPFERGGTSYPRVRVSAKFGSPVDVTLDPHTYLVLGAEDPHHRVTFAYPSDPGVLPALPNQIVWAGRTPWTQHFSAWTIVDGPLVLPTGLAPVFQGRDAIAKMVPTGREMVMPAVACTIGGRTVTALLDTGDSNIAMSLELAEELGVEPSGGALAIHGIGQYATGLAAGPGFAIGAVAFPAAKFALLHDIHRYGYDLVLGADVFAHVRVTLDYAKQEIRFAPPGDQLAPQDALQIHFENFIPVAQAWLGATPAALALDTGDDASVNLAGDFYARNPTLFAPTSSLVVTGVGGSSTQVIGTIPSVTLARFEVRQQKIGATKGLNATGDGHLGSGFLAHFTTTFDYAHASVELVPRGGDTAVSSVPSSSQ